VPTPVVRFTCPVTGLSVPPKSQAENEELGRLVRSIRDRSETPPTELEYRAVERHVGTLAQMLRATHHLGGEPGRWPLPVRTLHELIGFLAARAGVDPPPRGRPPASEDKRYRERAVEDELQAGRNWLLCQAIRCRTAGPSASTLPSPMEADSPTADPSAAAEVDLPLSEPPAPARRVSIAEFGRVTEAAAYHGGVVIDKIDTGLGEWIDVTGMSCVVVPGRVPTACPDAAPWLPPALLPAAEQAVRRLCGLPDGVTVHWLGHEFGRRSRCRCHPTAPYAAPFDRDKWAAVAARPALTPADHARALVAGYEQYGALMKAALIPDACRIMGLPVPKPLYPPPAAAPVAPAAAAFPPTSPHPNGVTGGCWVWWQGKRYDVPKGVVYRLIAHFWDRDSSSYDTLFDKSKGVFDDAVDPGSIRKRLSDANKALAKVPGFPWRLEADSEARVARKRPG